VSISVVARVGVAIGVVNAVSPLSSLFIVLSKSFPEWRFDAV